MKSWQTIDFLRLVASPLLKGDDENGNRCIYFSSGWGRTAIRAITKQTREPLLVARRITTPLSMTICHHCLQMTQFTSQYAAPPEAEKASSTQNYPHRDEYFMALVYRKDRVIFAGKNQKSAVVFENHVKYYYFSFSILRAKRAFFPLFLPYPIWKQNVEIITAMFNKCSQKLGILFY